MCGNPAGNPNPSLGNFGNQSGNPNDDIPRGAVPRRQTSFITNISAPLPQRLGRYLPEDEENMKTLLDNQAASPVPSR